MQTFLPHNDFNQIAKELDSKRLNKQILECYQILNVLSGNSLGWRNHPAVKMWQGWELRLFDYVLVMIEEAKRRGIKTDKNEENILRLHKESHNGWGKGTPTWFKDKEVMSLVTTTHKANLYKKDPVLYPHYVSAVTDKYNKPCCPERKEPCKYYWVTHKKVA